jgi:O-antigen/teichoic acid export membrane protein
MSRTTSALHLVLSGGSTQLCGFVLFVALARLFSMEGYATYRQLFLISQILGAFFLSAIPASALYFLPLCDTLEKKQEFVARSSVLLLGVGIGTGSLIAMLADPVGRWLTNPELGQYLRLIAPYPLTQMFIANTATTLIAQGRTRAAAAFSMAVALASTGTALSVAGITHDLQSVVCAVVGTSVAAGLFGMWLLHRAVGIRFGSPRASEGGILAQIRYCAPLGLAGGVSTWGKRVDQLWISYLAGPAAYGVYSVGAMELPLIGLLQGSVANVLLPEFTRGMKDGDRERMMLVWRASVRKMWSVLMPVLVLGFTFAEDLVVLTFGPPFRPAASVLRVYLLMIPVRTMTSSLILRALGKTRYELYGAAGFLMANAALGAVGIWTIGILGAAASTLVCTYLVWLYNLAVTRRYAPIRAAEFFPPESLLYAVKLALAVSPAVALKLFVDHVSVLLTLPLGAAGVGVMMWRAGVMHSLLRRPDLSPAGTAV